MISESFIFLAKDALVGHALDLAILEGELVFGRVGVGVGRLTRLLLFVAAYRSYPRYLQRVEHVHSCYGPLVLNGFEHDEDKLPLFQHFLKKRHIDLEGVILVADVVVHQKLEETLFSLLGELRKR